jgi:acetyl esterase/lipase
MSIRSVGLLLVSFTFHSLLFSQNVIPLYSGDIPNAKKTPADYLEQRDARGFILNVSVPTLTTFFPEKANGTAVIIAPSGGYEVWVDEGEEMAHAFNKVGVTAFVLKYRLPSDKIMIDKTIGPLQDAQMAIMTLRKRAAEWKIDPHKIGFVGMSAGGHIASTAGTHFDNPVIENKEKISLRPDFMILLYPVISLDPEMVKKTKTANTLLGEKPSERQINFFSNEKHVTSETPPTWLIHAGDDDHVSARHSLVFYDALLKANVKSEIHILSTGGHGFSLDHPTKKDKWMDWCTDWLHENGFAR